MVTRTALYAVLASAAAAADHSSQSAARQHTHARKRRRKPENQRTLFENVAESTAEEEQKFASEVVAAHIEEKIEAENHEDKKHKKVATHLPKPFHCFRTVAGTFDAMHKIVAAYPHLARIADIGNSYRGFDNKVLVLTSSGPNNSTDGEIEKGKLFLTFGVHARELASSLRASRT